MNTTHPDPVAAKKLREAIETSLKGSLHLPIGLNLDRILAAITPHLPALTKMPVAGEANPALTHPQIHLDYYKWFGSLNDFEKSFRDTHSKSFDDFHAIAMWVWSCSRETAARATPPSAPTNGEAPPQHATNDATPGAHGSQHVGNGVTVSSSWAVEAAKEILRIAEVEDFPKRYAAIITKHHARHAQSAGDGKDRERLDWWEKNPSRIVFSKGYHGSPDSWSWFDARGNSNAAPNLRSAIDAAMAQEGKP